MTETRAAGAAASGTPSSPLALDAASRRLPHEADAARALRRRRRAFTAICLGFFAVILDTTIVNVALPTVQQDLGASVTGLQWVANGYTLLFAALLLTAGAVSDTLGAKRVYGAGLAVFIAGSLWCAVAPSLTLLVAGRFLQGLGAAALMPASLALISHAYPDPTERTRAVAAWAAVAGAATAIGPILGGVLVDTVGWRSIFYVNLPVGAVGIALLAAFADETPRHRRSFDLIGQVLGVLALGAVAVALTEAGSFGWGSTPVIAAAIVTVLCGTTFVAVERRGADPMLPSRLFSNRTFSAANAVGLLLNFGIYGQVFVLSLYFQHLRRFSALETGLALLPFAGVTVVGPLVAGRMTSRLGARVVMASGQLSAAVGTLVVSFSGAATPYAWAAPGLFLLGVGFALSMPSLTTAVVLSAPRNYTGVASGVLNASRQVGGVLGVALLGTFVSGHGELLRGTHLALRLVAATFLTGAIVSLRFVARRPAADQAPAPAR